MPLAAFPKCFLDDLVVRKTMTVEQWIAMAADSLDVDGLEFYWGFVPHESPAELRRLRGLVSARGLTMPMMCYSPDYTHPDAAQRSREVQRQIRAIEVTSELGGKFCRVLSGQRHPSVSRSDGVQMAVECITALLPTAERCGVVLNLENHYKDGFWQYPEFAQRKDLFLEFLAALPQSPWLGVNYDPSNAVIAGDDPIALLEAVKHRVVTMHASDRYFEGGTVEDLRKLEGHPQSGYASILKHGVIGRGLNDYDKIFSILREVNFQGWISIEDGQDPEGGLEHLQLSAKFLREKMKQYGLP
ncbi:MAG TPA: sugar phosphate isomerase/epimerase family protein [Verrucomicrobiota bacterium]|nr:sugar phosphate isomerase/epimerase family protein [Verrucomicrobiota bacterium]